jgi:acyl-CoA reductase-like NAD-dependent aldehyde dehydrogenase
MISLADAKALVAAAQKRATELDKPITVAMVDGAASSSCSSGWRARGRFTPARKLAPALIAGNVVILKPATNTPLVALHLARALHDAGMPAGVLGTATGVLAVREVDGWDVHMPFGGFRDSGSAFKEQGLDALRFYTQTKTVAVHYWK